MTKEKLQELDEYYGDVLKDLKSHLQDGKTIIDGDTMDAFNELIRVISGKQIDVHIALNDLHFRGKYGTETTV